ncbi:MAG: hypothetical protein IPN01_20365 [Deltaproteobacteria bacterium]|nr:hypothetical protein [Deltaproteobacteria bacterium]
MSPFAPLFALAAAGLLWRSPGDTLTAVGLLGLGLALPRGARRRSLLGAVVAGLGLVALSLTTTLWAWLLAFELMSLGLERAGLTGAENRNASSIHYYSSICFLISFSLHEMLIAGPYSTGLFTLGMGLRLGLSLAASPPPVALGLTPICGLIAITAAQGPLGLNVESLAPWAALASLSPVLCAALGLRIGPAVALAQLGLGLAAWFTLPDPSWRLPWALTALATGPLLTHSSGTTGAIGRAWAAGASPMLLITIAVLRAWTALGLGALGALLLLPNLVALSVPAPSTEDEAAPDHGWLALGLAVAALVAAWSLV